MSQFLHRLEADVFKSRSLTSKSKKTTAPSADEFKTSNFPALQKAISNTMMAKILQGVKNKSGRFSQKEAKDLLAALGPKVLSAVLVDLGVVSKSKQANILRQFAALLPSKK